MKVDMQFRHKNNFDALRLLAALVVFYSHSYAIFGFTEPTILEAKPPYLTITLGRMGVCIFFIISGFLVTKSLVNSKNLRSFFLKRAIRIYPAYLVNILFIFAVIIPLVSTFSANLYFASVKDVFNPFNIFNALLFFHLPSISGVFADNMQKYLINGSLWTLSWEVGCYLGIVVFFGISRNFDKRLFFALPLCLLIINFFIKPIQIPDFSIQFICAFALGAFIYIYREKIPLKLSYFLCLSGALLLMIVFNIYFIPAYLVILSYLVIFVAMMNDRLSFIGKYGDFSYGIYIYAWPVQQSIARYYNFENKNFIPYFILSLTITLLLAIASWKVIEYPMLLKVREKISN